MHALNSVAQASALTTHTALTAWSVASNFLIIIVLVALLFLFARYVGRGPFVALLFSFYAAYALYIAFPYASLLPSAPLMTALLAHIGLYAGLAGAFYITLRRVVVSDFLSIGFLGLIILSFFGAAFLLALAYHLFSVATAYHFTSAISALFAPSQYFFWWFAAPAIGLFFLAR